MDFLIYRLQARTDHATMLVHDLQHFKPVEYWEEENLAEIALVKTPYENPLIVVFREGTELGIRLDGVNPVRGESWWRERGFQLAESDPYIDPETNEERIDTGPPLRFPVERDDLINLVVAALTEYFGEGSGDYLVATENENADDWSDMTPLIISEVPRI